MLLIIKFLAKVLSVLNSEISPSQIAAGFAFGVLIGLLPLTGLMPTVFLLIAFLININLSIMFASAAIFKIIAFVVDPLANQVGYTLLVKIASLRGLWTHLYNVPLVPYTKFNNTIVMGSLIIGLLLLVPMYFVGYRGVTQYRSRWHEKFEQMKVMKILKASSLYKFYLSYQGFKGE